MKETLLRAENACGDKEIGNLQVEFMISTRPEKLSSRLA